MKPSFLDIALEPTARERFLKAFPGEPFIYHGAPERFSPLLSAPELQSVHTLAAAFQDSVIAWFQDDAAFGDSAPTPLRAPDSLGRYESGALLQFNNVARWVPAIPPILRSLEQDLDLPYGTVDCQVFASKASGGAKPHWDNDPVFTVQLRGSKEWQFAPQTYVEEPLHNHVCGSHRGQLAGYHDGPLPAGMPEGATTVVLHPGSILFLPRGYLHATRSVGHSFSLAFDFPIPTWADIVVKHIQKQLQRDVRWRRFALGLGGADLSGPAEKLGGMLSDLSRVVEELVHEPIRAVEGMEVRLLPGAGRHFKRGPAVAQISSPPDGIGPCVIVSHPGLGSAEIELSPEFVPLCLWLIDLEGTTTDRDILQRAAALDPAEVSSIVCAFVEVGLLLSLESA